MKKFLFNNPHLVILLFMLMTFSILSPFFFTKNNLLVIIQQASILGILGLAQTLVILIGGLDLAVGSEIAFSTTLIAPLLLMDIPLILPIILIMIVGLGIGFFNGLIITKLEVPAFIATYGMMYIARGFAWIWMGRNVVYMFPENFRFLGSGSIGGISVVTIFFVVTFIILWFLLKRTTFGKKVYMVGANPLAAKFSGINVKKIRIYIYSLCGLVTAFAGVLSIARINAAEPGIGESFALNSIAVVLIGGTSLSGGRGGVTGTLFGAIIISCLKNFMNLVQVKSYLQSLFIGILIIFAVFLNQLIQKKKTNSN